MKHSGEKAMKEQWKEKILNTVEENLEELY